MTSGQASFPLAPSIFDFAQHGQSGAWVSELLPWHAKMVDVLEDTLVIWGGEFGRTVYSQGALTETDYGRDHRPRCFTIWMAGAGIKGGQVYGETDEISYNIVDRPVHIRDLHATVLHSLGLDHHKLTFKFQGLDQKLTGVEPSKIITDLFA